MENNVNFVGQGAGPVPVELLAGRAQRAAAARPEEVRASGPDDVRPRVSTDAEFLASQATAETRSSARDTFARFIVDQDTHQVSVQIVDAAKQEVIRTIPSDDLRQLAQKLRASNGFVLDSAV